MSRAGSSEASLARISTSVPSAVLAEFWLCLSGAIGVFFPTEPNLPYTKHFAFLVILATLGTIVFIVAKRGPIPLVVHAVSFGLAWILLGDYADTLLLLALAILVFSARLYVEPNEEQDAQPASVDRRE
ncbi:MAG: hypothetical protein ACR2HJ_06705 [Fimbriimonadales bacterium]